MKTYEIAGHISMATLNDIEETCADMKKYKSLENDFMTKLEAIRSFRGERMSYKDMLLCKDMFKKGYLAAHVVGDKYDES